MLTIALGGAALVREQALDEQQKKKGVRSLLDRVMLPTWAFNGRKREHVETKGIHVPLVVRKVKTLCTREWYQQGEMYQGRDGLSF